MKSFGLLMSLMLVASGPAFGVELEDLRDTRARWAALLAFQDLNVSYDGVDISALTPMAGPQAFEGVRSGFRTGVTNFDFFRFLGSGGSYRGFVFEVIKEGLHDFCNAEVLADGDLGSANYSRVKVRVYGCINHILAEKTGAPLDRTIDFSPNDLKTKTLRCEQAYRDSNSLCLEGAARTWAL